MAQTDNSWETAGFYAAACSKYLLNDYERGGDSAMQYVQACLMLGYHEWTAYVSRTGYMRIRNAVGFAQMNGYHYDDNLGTGREGHDKAPRREAIDAASRRDRFIQEESRRRTFWSCFIMDRYLSVGRRRPKIIQVEDLKENIQIPCSDKNFVSGRAVKTRFFGETDLEFAQRRKKTNDEAMQRNNGQIPERIEWEDREDDGMLGRYMFALDHFSAVNKWSNEGGRRCVSEIQFLSNVSLTVLDRSRQILAPGIPKQSTTIWINVSERSKKICQTSYGFRL